MGSILRTVPLAVVLAAATETSARAMDPGVAQEAVILLKILAYDPGLEGSTAPLQVVVLDGPGATADRLGCDTFAEALTAASGQLTVSGRPVTLERMPYVDETTLAASVAKRHPDLIFVCDTLRAQAGAIARVTREADVLTATRDRSLATATLSVGVVRRDARVEIVINLPAARAEGTTFPAELLQLATVVR